MASLEEVQRALGVVSAKLQARQTALQQQVQALRIADGYLGRLPTDLRRYDIGRRILAAHEAETEQLRQAELYLAQREEQLVAPLRLQLIQKLAVLTELQRRSAGIGTYMAEISAVKARLRELGHILPETPLLMYY